ncbi:MAG: HAD-IIIC family phosphatase [Acidobacteria bacterium]|nr:HAD-IIIC family phosphatase [Acidobacteriota bacterium]
MSSLTEPVSTEPKQDGGGSKASKSSEKTLLLVGDTLVDPLIRLLETSPDEPKIRAVAAPYSQVHQVLVDSEHAAWRTNPDYVLIWTTPTLTLPAFQRVIQFQSISLEIVLEEVEQFAELVIQCSHKVGLVLVTTWAIPSYLRWIQSLSWKHHYGLANLLARANLLLAEKCAPYSNIILLDMAYWQISLSSPAYDLRMYALGKILYSYPLFAKAAAEIKAVIRGVLGLGKKVLVCDLDNTLWGGVAADDGVESIKLGSPDPLGECYRDFQLALKSLKSRGVLLAVMSKNNEEFALSVIDNHPGMVLRREDFVCWRINWNNKVENLFSMAEELNLGLEAFVVLDDSPQERDQIRHFMPQVYVPDLPASPADYMPFVSSLQCFETANINKEDLERTAMYHADRDRKLLQKMTGGIEEWLNSLGICVKAGVLKRESLPRAAQLLNKTNQFNLSVRRMEEQALWDWACQRGNAAYVFQVGDRFGDLGLVGLVSLSRLSPRQARIVDFVMSCRAMGKRVEEALLGYAVDKARQMGVDSVVAPASQTARNGPAVEFFSNKYSNQDSAEIDVAQTGIPPAIRVEET